MASIGLKKGFNVGRVINRVIHTILSIYIGAEILTEVSNVVNGTTSPLYAGMTIIGWTVSATNQVTAVNGDGILSVIGIIAIASIILEFVNFRM